MKDQTREEPAILAAAERRMHAWVLSQQIEDRQSERKSRRSTLREAVRFVAVSRQAGAGGSEIAQLLGRRLNWRVFDKNLLDCIAEHCNLPRAMLDLVDETRSNWVYDMLGTWMDQRIVPHEKFAACLARAVAACAEQGNAVFVGRGAQFLLPRQESFAVRIIASVQYRTRRFSAETGLSEAEAQRRVEEIEAGRCEFVEQFFHRNLADPHNYDLVIDVERCGTSATVEAILAAMGR